MAASEPNEKLGSNGTLKSGSLGENDSATYKSAIRRKAITGNKETAYMSEVV